MSEKMISVNGVNICTECFGDSNNPAILLIMGANASMVWWDVDFCERLAATGRYVIRYDNRDVGKSTYYEPGQIGYTIVDLVDDATGILDAYNIKEAHVVGMSLGGMVAQILALRHAKRVSTATLIATTAIGSRRTDLPHIDTKILEYHSAANTVNWDDQESAVKYMVKSWQLLNGSKHDFDEKRIYELARTDFNRANNLLSQFNHALLKGGDEYASQLKDIKVPILVIHGTEDRVLPYEHGKVLSKEIPNSKLLTLEGVGHEIHYQDWDTIIDAIFSHTETIKSK
ncbi:alpha/beta fold hydrolase [Oceanobacillus sp. J11TS1]|uniref:alpha/beta fold hydrolase n=1 Tax=Oceanobacillus sp. J11TS1 TaxID=2807191 RepID=UPI001B153122|nr:alpha/beta hydrolase [Oceanobacillus sp. J11TS1]GIO24791.1 carboxylesterase [Oceanobacillus sp. J11TS1]